MSKIILIQRVCTENGTEKKEESTSTMRTKTQCKMFLLFMSMDECWDFPLFHLMLQTLNGIRKFSA